MSNLHPLRIYRKRHGLTLDKLAELVGMTNASLSRIETGLQQPSADVMRRLIAATDGEVTASDLLFVPAASTPPSETADDSGVSV